MEFELPLSMKKEESTFCFFLNKKKNGLWKIYPVHFQKMIFPLVVLNLCLSQGVQCTSSIR